MIRYRIVVVFICLLSGCSAQIANSDILPGAYQVYDYLPQLKNKKVALFVNHTSKINNTHLVDTLLHLDVGITKVFTPEHGFLGNAPDGEIIDYEQFDYPFEMISLYGDSYKPSLSQMQNIDVLIIDIQDVGVRFYTYASTMTYLMEACAKANIPVILLDRPNPNGSYVDGPVLKKGFESFIGLHPIPIVHGLTMGELAMMINDEGWLGHGIHCSLTIITVRNWSYNTPYSLPVRPSPNLPNDLAIALYPSLGLFEGTVVSVGRGTDFPFQVYGHPKLSKSTFTFTPLPNEGSKYPPLEGLECHGVSFLETTPSYQLTLKYLMDSYKKLTGKVEKPFFSDYFKSLAGTDALQKKIEAGWTEDKIRESWQADLEVYKRLRNKYLLYSD